jgi:hypothetical protein
MDHYEKLNVSRLITAFQATLFNHLISAASAGQKSSSSLDYLPFPLDVDPVLDDLEIQSSKISITHHQHVPEMMTYDSDEHEMEVEIIEHDTFSQNLAITPSAETPKAVFIQEEPEEFIVRSQPNGLSAHLKRCRGELHHRPVAPDQFEFQFEEKSAEENGMSFFMSAKVLQRMNKALRSQDSSVSQSYIQQEVTEYDTVPEFSHVSVEKPDSKTLYAEVIAMTYSQGGDGFQLHPGDIVQVVQFLKEFHMVECRWQGMQGLFPSDKIKVMTAPSQPLTQKIINLAKKELFKKDIVKTSSKLLERLSKKQVSLS